MLFRPSLESLILLGITQMNRIEKGSGDRYKEEGKIGRERASKETLKRDWMHKIIMHSTCLRERRRWLSPPSFTAVKSRYCFEPSPCLSPSKKRKTPNALTLRFHAFELFFFFFVSFVKSELLQLKFDNWKVKLQTVEKKFYGETSN